MLGNFFSCSIYYSKLRLRTGLDKDSSTDPTSYLDSSMRWLSIEYFKCHTIVRLNRRRERRFVWSRFDASWHDRSNSNIYSKRKRKIFLVPLLNYCLRLHACEIRIKYYESNSFLTFKGKRNNFPRSWSDHLWDIHLHTERFFSRLCESHGELDHVHTAVSRSFTRLHDYSHLHNGWCPLSLFTSIHHSYSYLHRIIIVAW